MTKERYQKKSAYNRGILLKQWSLLIIVFILGYFSASLYQFSSVKNVIMSYLFNKQPLAVIHTKTTAVLPPPKFEFYTLLTKDKNSQLKHTTTQAATIHEHVAETTVVSNTQSVATVTHPDASRLTKDLYLVQVASFRRLNEAERLKSILVTKGINVSINSASQQGVQWYRVVMGPFASKQQAQQAQQFFSQREHTIGMIRRMDA